MKVLITGATGFLGSHLCHRFVNEGHDVTAFVRPSSNTMILDGLNLSHAVGDITDPSTVEPAVAGQDIVIHAAALTRDVFPRLQEIVNVDGTLHIVSACQTVGVRRLLYISSVAALGVPVNSSRPADENLSSSSVDHDSNYAISKRKAENEVLSASKNSLDTVVVNPSTILGPFGDTFRGAEMIERVRRRRVVPCYSGGVNTVHVDDVVDGIVRAIAGGSTGERYILGGENLSYKAMAEVVTECLGIRRLLVTIPVAASGILARLSKLVGKLVGRDTSHSQEVLYYVGRYHFYDSNKARQELGYNPRLFSSIVAEYMVTKGLLRPRSTH